MTDMHATNETWFARPPLVWLVLATLVACVCLWLRLDLIEPLSRTAQCAANPDQFACDLRAFLVSLFQRERVGWVALGVTLAGVLIQWRWLVGLGLLVGAAAMMLYSVEPGAAAVLVASLFLLRSAKSG
ncbi:MAG: hypothetical protein AB8C46_22665 [Burkholderiaceae bacterium]